MNKRKISLVIVLAMLLSLMIPTVAIGAAKDYSGHWAEKTIQEWFDKDMLKGYNDGTFRPDAQITRAEFMTMVNNAFKFTEKADIAFNDVDSDDWYYSEVQKAVKAEYLLGYEDNTARPEVNITRQQAALIIARIKGLSNYSEGVNRFSDASKIATWAKGGVGAVANAKYMIGYTDNTFKPLKFITRAEAVVTIDRTLKKASGEDKPSTGGNSDGSGPGPITPPTTAAAISYSYDEVEYIDLEAETATGSSITTTSASIFVKVVTYDDEELIITTTTPGGITTMTAITTETAIGTVEHTVKIDLEVGENKITFKVDNEVYYIFTVTREKE